MNYALINNSFKTFLIALLLLILLFSISCNNKKTTGGYTGGGSLLVSVEANNSYDITVISQNSSSSVYSQGIIGFAVNGASDYDVSIQSVKSDSNNTLTLDASNFSYNKSTKTLTLSTSGLTKFNNATLTEATAYQYTITFRFTDSSNTSKKTTYNVTINLYKAKFITKTEVEDMVKSIGTVLVQVPASPNVPVTFNFSTASFKSGNPNFNVKSAGNAGNIKLSVRTARVNVFSSLSKTENYQKYFSGVSYKAPEFSGANLTLYCPLKLKSGYALSSESEVAHLTDDGLSIQLTLDSNQDWE
ncbi:hypothetical protein [Brachyspira catarrhinii]|uniref:Uncharacterized protein n=1 Tax=Brachyspira catarrhinii TaxID=2528966 RepID=A0ABY2TRP7_9SPIR|nr:hypothetical protein [Brachyspira catarrhinii]TKZ35568.1 hypothetical protein EZH24_04615 [Brachyspira catarrhinii]